MELAKPDTCPESCFGVEAASVRTEYLIFQSLYCNIFLQSHALGDHCPRPMRKYQFCQFHQTDLVISRPPRAESNVCLGLQMSYKVDFWRCLRGDLLIMSSLISLQSFYEAIYHKDLNTLTTLFAAPGFDINAPFRLECGKSVTYYTDNFQQPARVGPNSHERSGSPD